MGCWNETCVLTRTPIEFGASVVALGIVIGPPYREPAGGGFNNSLFFGLPYKGKYDDYGGVEELERPDQSDFALQAFAASGMYRKHRLVKSYGSSSSRWIASSRDVFWGLEHELIHLFYDEAGVRASDVGSYDKDAHNRTAMARQMCDQALKAFGDALSTAQLPEPETEQEAALLELVSQAFGRSRAWAALHVLRRKGLFAKRHHLLMRREAYDAVVADFGQRIVAVRSSSTRAPMREVFASMLAEWITTYKSEVKRLTEMFGEVDAPRPDADELKLAESRKRNQRIILSMAPKGRYMRPLTSPWEKPEAPLVGHFWGGASLDDILGAHLEGDILDYFVFQWARSYLRIDLLPPASGSQCRESVLHHAMMQATYDRLRADGGLRCDFDGTIHGD